MSAVVLYPLKVLLPYNCDITAVVNVPIHILRAKKHFFPWAVTTLRGCISYEPVLSYVLNLSSPQASLFRAANALRVTCQLTEKSWENAVQGQGKSWVMPRVKSGGHREKKVAVLDANLGEFLNGLLCWLEPPIHQINSIRCGISHVFCHKPAKTRQIGWCGRNSHHSTLRCTKPITTSTIANPCRKQNFTKTICIAGKSNEERANAIRSKSQSISVTVYTEHVV